MKKHIPNIITCGNLFCGCLAIVSALKGNLVWCAYFVGIAAVLDFLDGFAARILKVNSEIGKQLDSLADMVTFGVVPGMVMFMMLSHINIVAGKEYPFFAENSWIAYLGFLITVFSCLRLAKFNIDTRQSDSFIGVPTPANTILICSLPLIANLNDITNPVQIFSENYSTFGIGSFTFFSSLAIKHFLLTPYFFIFLIILMSYLMIAELPLFALKFKSFEWAENKIRYVFLLISVLLFILFQFIAIPFIIFLYIILSIINNSKINNEI